MSSFKKNRSIPTVNEYGKEIINQSEDSLYNIKYNKKEITIPFTEEMSSLLERIFTYFEGDISRRKLCAKYLLKALKEAVQKLEIN
jgi:hypothetical protein